MELSENSVSEYPGIACLVVLHRKNSALTFCRIGRASPEMEVRDVLVELEEEVLERSNDAPLLKWGDQLAKHTLWRHKVPGRYCC